MNVSNPVIMVLVGLVALTGTVAAAPGNAPVSTPEDPSDSAGPPSALPAPVPDFVGEIHAAISDALNGAMDALGSTVSEIAKNGTALMDLGAY